MAKETKPQTYRVSNEVDAELRQLAKKHGGIDKALRVILDIAPDIRSTPITYPDDRQVLIRRPLREKGDTKR